ncbi:heparanase-like protein 2 [Diospyros lotus]|uniref:heparanase-like protein 2 n=1 Tax=Diospyros lotus TaxID=55363 RepID=UPI00224F0969|nr:heparanase-like protein 2 [Diospyros lotus]
MKTVYFSIIVLVVACLLLGTESAMAADVTVKIQFQGVTTIAKTDDNFVCLTLDWWPANKCDHNQCPWGKAGILNLDLENRILSNSIKGDQLMFRIFDCLFTKSFMNILLISTCLIREVTASNNHLEIAAFNPLRIRIGGSLQDQVVYEVGKVKKCPYFKKIKDGMFGFSHGCLPMQRWDGLNNLFNQTGAKITFGLNALSGRKKSANANDDVLWVGDWNPKNARDFMEYTISKGYETDSYELGNELCGTGVSARVEAEQYAKDTIALRELVNELYPDPATRPKVLGPAGFYDEQWFNTYLQTTGPNVLDGVTHHIYNLGSGTYTNISFNTQPTSCVDPTLIYKVQDPFFLDQIAQTYKDISKSIEEFGPWAGAWVGEAGGAYNNGGKDVSHTFANGFWYLDQLGMASNFNHKVFCRQALIGGNYALLNTTTFIPNPDYYGALLWHRLMGSNVLGVMHDSSPYLRVYSHCSKNKLMHQIFCVCFFPSQKGITLLIINMSISTTFHVSVVDDMNFYPQGAATDENKSYREEYHLTPKEGNIQSDVVLLNGTPLQLTDSMDIPEMNPVLVDASTPIDIDSRSIIFVTLTGFEAPACA